MANPAYSIDFSPVGNIGNEMVQGAQMQRQAAFQDIQGEHMKAATEGEKVNTAIKNIELDKAQKEKAAGEKFVPFSLLDPLKEKAPKVYETYMSFAKQFETEVGGVKGFTANDQQTVKKMMADNADMQRQVGLAHIQDLDEQRAKRKNKIDDLTAEIESGKRDPRGALIPNPKKQAELLGLQAEDKKDADQQVAALNHVKTIEERIATEKIQQQAQAKANLEAQKEQAADIRTDKQIKGRHEDAAIREKGVASRANKPSYESTNVTFKDGTTGTAFVDKKNHRFLDADGNDISKDVKTKLSTAPGKTPIPFGGGATPQGKKDSFGHVVGEVFKGHKYIGNDKWEPIAPQ